MIQADSEIATKTDAVNIYVVGSAAAMPKSSDWIKRLAAYAAAKPKTEPIRTGRIPSRTMAKNTCDGAAPRAMRIPISFDPCTTEYAKTAYSGAW